MRKIINPLSSEQLQKTACKMRLDIRRLKIHFQMRLNTFHRGVSDSFSRQQDIAQFNFVRGK